MRVYVEVEGEKYECVAQKMTEDFTNFICGYCKGGVIADQGSHGLRMLASCPVCGGSVFAQSELTPVT